MDTLKYLFSDLMENSINEAMIYKTYNHVIVKMKSWIIKCPMSETKRYYNTPGRSFSTYLNSNLVARLA